MLTKSFPLTLPYIPTDNNDGIRRSVAGAILYETKRTKGWNSCQPVAKTANPLNSGVDSNTVTGVCSPMMDRWTIQELAEAVNAWCRDREVQPANGQAASELSVRTLHYYRGSGLLDAPESGGGRGYGRRHFLQLAAIRILQAQGLPLSRIQQLLFGRSDQELEQIAESAGKIDHGTANVRPGPLVSPETWATYPVSRQVFLVAREGARLSAAQLEAIRKICDSPHKKFPKTH
ncbi:MAG: MerR family transcriptional regulator [Terrimicrobiaceae bacterium]